MNNDTATATATAAPARGVAHLTEWQTLRLLRRLWAESPQQHAARILDIAPTLAGAVRHAENLHTFAVIEEGGEGDHHYDVLLIVEQAYTRVRETRR